MFLALPVLAIFLRVPPGDLVAQLGEERARDALLVSLKTSLIAHALILLVGTPAAYLLATRRSAAGRSSSRCSSCRSCCRPRSPGSASSPPSAAAACSAASCSALGLEIPFTQLAVVLAVCFVASPFYLRGAIAAFEAVDPALPAAARTLGAGPFRVFGRVALPLALGGLGAGSTLAFARGLGEFGATIMFAGSLPGRTQTAPLAIYDAFDEDFDVALALGASLVVVSAALLLAVKLVPSWTRSTSPSTTLFAPSASR